MKTWRHGNTFYSIGLCVPNSLFSWIPTKDQYCGALIVLWCQPDDVFQFEKKNCYLWVETPQRSCGVTVIWRLFLCSHGPITGTQLAFYGDDIKCYSMFFWFAFAGIILLLNFMMVLYCFLLCLLMGFWRLLGVEADLLSCNFCYGSVGATEIVHQGDAAPL